MGRASRRKGTDEHLDEMAIRAAKRDLRRRRRIGLLIAQAQAREFARQRVQQLLDAAQAGAGLDENSKVCVPVDCSQAAED